MVNRLGIAENLSEYNDNGILIYSFGINSDGFCKEYIFDDDGNELTFKDSNGHLSESTYDDSGNELTFKNSKGFWHEYTYDASGDLLTHKTSKVIGMNILMMMMVIC